METVKTQVRNIYIFLQLLRKYLSRHFSVGRAAIRSESPLSAAFLRSVAVAAVASLFVLSVTVCEAATQTSQPPKGSPASAASPTASPSPAPVPSVIPVAEIATQATKTATTLRDFATRLAPSTEIQAIHTVLPDVARNMELELAGTTAILRGQPSLETLQSQQQLWQGRQVQMNGWLTSLTKRAGDLQNALNQLAEQKQIWTKTRDAAKASKAPQPVLQQIGGTMAAVEAAQIPLRDQLATVLDLQGRVATGVAISEKALAQVARTQQSAVKGIFVRDSQPIWSRQLWVGGLDTLPQNAVNTAAAYWTDIVQYFRNPSQRVSFRAALFALLSILFLAARIKVRRWTAASELESTALHVFHHPFAAALTVSLIAITSPLSQIPGTVRGMFQVLSLVPMIILVRPSIASQMLPGLYVLAVLFTLDTVRQAFSGIPLIGQATLVFDSLAGIAAAFFLLRNLRKVFGEAKGSIHAQALINVVAIFLFVFTAGLAAGALGHMRLARLLTPGILSGGVLALEMYALICVINSIIAFFLRVWPLKLLGMVRHNRRIIERRAYHLLIWLAIIGWVVRSLSYLGLLEPTISGGAALLGTEFHHGGISISLGDILDFFLTVWAAYLLSGLIRFVLREDVYPRIRIAPGKSYAVSSLIHYIILSLGVVAGIGVLGIKFTKLTVLTGAFGVGIGFGMQSVVNNFISGLILLFERPVKVGDMVEIGDLLGKVRHIGIRSSTVHTRQGADIIVPNSQLITEKVTNWTLSDMLRRIDLPVGVNYSSAPSEVIKVLEGVAAAHPQVLRDPPPQALFTGYGDSSLNFELRAWAQFEDWWRIRSDLAVAMYDAVHAAGMSFPFPQREVRLLGDPGQLPGQNEATTASGA